MDNNRITDEDIESIEWEPIEWNIIEEYERVYGYLQITCGIYKRNAKSEEDIMYLDCVESEIERTRKILYSWTFKDEYNDDQDVRARVFNKTTEISEYM